MEEIPIFDSLTHPTPTGRWLEGSALSANVYALAEDMERYNVKRALAVGLDLGGYEESTFPQWVARNLPKAMPIAYIDVNAFQCGINSLPEYMSVLKKNGYVGIKLHPRLGAFDFTHPLLAEIINAAREQDLISLICTYPYSQQLSPSRLRLDQLLEVFPKLHNPKLLLLHGGLNRLIDWSEAIRPWPNVLLDLSFTIARYAGSSVDQDIHWLFSNFDQRICIGSDHPQFSLQQLRERFNKLSLSLDITKATNIAYDNLSRLFAVN